MGSGNATGKWLLIVVGLVLVLVGAYSVWHGLDIIQIERGWSAVIAGTTALCTGILTIAMALLLQQVAALQRSFESGERLRDPARPAIQSARESDADDTVPPPPTPVEVPVAPIPAPEAAALPLAPAPRFNVSRPMPQAPSPEPVTDRVEAETTRAEVTEAMTDRAPTEEPESSSPEPAKRPLWMSMTFGGRKAPKGDVPSDDPATEAGDPADPSFQPERLQAAETEPEAEPAPAEPEAPEEELHLPRAVPLAPIATYHQPEPAEDKWIETPPAVDEAPDPALDWLRVRRRDAETSADEEAPRKMPSFMRRQDQGYPGAAWTDPSGDGTPAGSESPPVEASAEPQAESPADATLPKIIGRYSAQGTNYTLYADGSIEAETKDGTFRFPSMVELREHIESRGNATGTPA